MIADVRKENIYIDGDFNRCFGNFTNALINSGIQPTVIKRAKAPTAEELLEYLNNMAEKLGRTPLLIKDIVPDKKYLTKDFLNTFGSYNKALLQAGLEVNIAPRFIKKIASKTRLIKHLQKLAARLGRTPMYKDIVEDGKFPEHYYKRQFGTFNKAFLAAGLALNRRQKQKQEDLAPEVLLNYLKTLETKLGRVPGADDITRDKKYTIKNFSNFFGSFTDALDIAGLRQKKSELSDQQLIDLLKGLNRKNGHLPRLKEISEAMIGYRGGYGTYYRRFGSLDNAFVLAGLDPAMKEQERKKVKDEDLLCHLKMLFEKYGKIPTHSIILKDEKYHPRIYGKRFVSLQNALERAGLKSMTAL